MPRIRLLNDDELAPAMLEKVQAIEQTGGDASLWRAFGHRQDMTDKYFDFYLQSKKHVSGKELFAFYTKRIPTGFIDIDTKTGEIVNNKRVDSKTAWNDVPTPSI